MPDATQDEFGGIAVDEAPSKDEFGGIALPDLIESKAEPIPSAEPQPEPIPSSMLAPGKSIVEPTATDEQHPEALQPFSPEPVVNIAPEAVQQHPFFVAAKTAATLLGPKAQQFEQGLAKGTAETLSGFTTEESLATLPAFLIPYVGQALALYMGGKATYSGTKNFIEAIKEGDYEKAGKELPSVGIGLLMLHGGVKTAKDLIRPTEPALPKTEAAPPEIPVQPVNIQPGAENAIHSQGEPILRPLQQPEVTEESTREMPTAIGGEETDARGRPVAEATAGEARPSRLLLEEQPPPQTVYPLATKNGQLVDAYDRPVDKDHNLISPSGVATPGGPAEAQARLHAMLERERNRLIDESAGQEVLDQAEESGRTPDQITQEFFRDVYPTLPKEQQAKLDAFFRASVGGAKPGDVIGTEPGPGGTRIPLVAKSWMDIIPSSISANRIDQLQGTDRGLVAMMEYGNRFRKFKESPESNLPTEQPALVGREGETAKPEQGAPKPQPTAQPTPEPGAAIGTKDPRLLSDAELNRERTNLDAAMAPVYAKLDAIPEDNLFIPRTTKYTPEAQALYDQIAPFDARKQQVQFEITRRAYEAKHKANMEARDKRVAEAPVFQRRNGWEIVKEGVDYVLRHPETKEDIYRGILTRVREVADESKPEPSPPEPTAQRAQPEETPTPEPPEAPFGSIGPGAASRNEPPYSATSQLIDRLKTAPPGGFKERVSWREKAADEWARGKTTFERALARVQAIKESLKETQRGVRTPTDLDRRISELDWQLQRSSAENKELGKTLMKSAPNQLVREATALWIDSGEDAAAIRATLDKLPDGTPPRIRRALELATHLPEEGLKLAEEIKLFNAMRETDAIDSEIFERGLEDYYTHIWQKPSNMPDGIRAALSNGRINTYFQFAKERRIPDFLTGIEQGKVPVLDPARVLPFYSYALDRAIASREFIRNASELNASDGRPLLANTGSRSETTSTEYAVVGDGKTRARRVFDSREEAESALGEDEHIVEREKSMLLIRPQGRFKDMEGYQPVNHPALRKWKWADTDENGRTVLYQGELLVHPDHWKRIANFMDRQRLTPSPATRALLRASGEVKAAKLGLFSLFHDVHVASHAVWHWTNPFKAIGEGAKIDWESPATRFAVEKGHLKLAPDPAELNVYAEGLGSTGLVHKIPIIGPLSRVHSEWLFGELIPRLKLRTFENAYERNIKARDNLPGKLTGLKGLTDEEIAARVGDSVNNAYGELNHLFLGKHGRNPQVQRFLRGIFLAPDFGEARLRFVEKAFTKAGNEERLALATMALTTYALARVANWMSHGDPEMDWKNAFRVKAGNHWWSMRSVAGDVWHAMRDFSNFAYVRLNPLYSHAIGDWIYQRDPRTGLKLTTWDRLVKRRLEDLVPINATGLTQEDKQVWESFVSSLGLQVQRETPLQAVRRMFSDYKDKSKDPKIQAQVERARAEAMAPSDYRDLDLALQFENYDKAREAIEKLRLTHTDKAIFDRMNPFTAQGNNRPLFHESFAVERRFYNELPAKERITYAKAIQDRKDHWKAFQSLWGQRKKKE